MKKIKSIVIIFFVAVLVFNNITTVFGLSGSGNADWTGGQYDSKFITTESIKYNRGILVRKLTNLNSKEKITVFCAEHSEDFVIGTVNNGDYYAPKDKKVKEACKVAYLGWYIKYKDLVVDISIEEDKYYDIRKDYAFTQQYIWEILEQTNATFIDSSIQSEYNLFKKEIDKKIENIEKKPSFNGDTIEVQLGSSKIIEDTNKVLAEYSSIDKVFDGIRFIHNKGENTLTVTIQEECKKEKINITDNTMKELGLIKEETKNNDTTIYLAFKEGVQDQLYSLNYNEPISMSLNVIINSYGKIEISKLDTEKKLIDGAIFNVKGKNYNKDITVTNGKITIENLRSGKYTITEKVSPQGYLIDSKEYVVEVKANQTAKQKIVNNEPKGVIEILKKDVETGSINQGDSSFEGAVYKVYAKEEIYNKSKTKKYYSQGDLVATRIMDKEGKTEEVANLPLGKYIVKEEKAPEGYLLDKNEYIVELKYKDQKTKVISEKVISNEQVKKMKLHIFKTGINGETGLMQGIEGAEFTIKLESDVEKALEKGYTYEEIWSGLDEFCNTVNVNSKRVLEAQKIAPTYEIISTNKEGNAYTKNKLPFGKYIVKETKAPTDFKTAADFTFWVTEDENEIKEDGEKVKHLVVNDERLDSYLRIIKKDAKTNKEVSLSSATFEIKALIDIFDRSTGKILYKKGDKVTQKIGGTTFTSFTTNAENKVVPDNSYICDNDPKGSVSTPLILPIGEYEIIEIKSPNGFLGLNEAVKFEIKNVKDYDVNKDGEFIKTITVKNEQPTGTLIINKNVKLGDKIDKSLLGNISDLSEIQFKLVAKENIINAIDGSIIYENGKEIGVYNLNSEGYLKIEDLPLGIYELQEVKTLDGLVLDETAYTVEFIQKDNITKIYTETKNIVNNTTKLEISKTSITGDRELAGAELSVIDEKGSVIDSWTSTNKAHYIEGLIAGNTYILRENLAPLGYVKSTDIKFTVQNTPKIQKVKMIDKIVEVSKTDFASGKEIEGAKLKVADENGNIIDEWISGKTPHKVKGLEEGKKYILTEVTAPNGYEIAEKIEFKVSYDKKVQKIEMKDKPIMKVIKHEKNDDVEIKEIPVTGDKNVTLWITLLGTSIVFIVGIWIYKKRIMKY